MDDERNPILHPDETSAAEAPREVVLRFDAPRPQPVVERYVAPEPPPGQRTAEPQAPPQEEPVPSAERYVFTPPEEPAHRSRVGLWVLLGCIAALLIALLILVVVQMRRTVRQGAAQQPSTVYRYEYNRPSGYTSDGGGTETTIARYRTDSNVRLRYAENHGSELTIQEVYTRVNPCTVTVATALPSGTAIIGTGVIFTSDGYILTNAHVISGGSECYVVLDNGANYEAKLVGYDEEKDLAVIKINAHLLPTAEFGDSDALTVGDTVYAIGNPLGVNLRGTLTNGIVSAINRDVLVDGVKMTLIQTNAALNNGNSGGPLINIYGQVVGINVMKMGSSSATTVEGLGFAIPISSTAWMVDDLIAYGEVHNEPVLGITVLHDTVTLPTGETALQVYEVTEGSGAGRAGLLPGDCIVRADGDPLEAVNDLLRARRRYRAGDTLTLEVERDGERTTVDVTLSESTES